MKIYAVADVHGHFSRLEKIKTNAGKTKPDVIVIAGDITRRWNPVPFITELAKLSIPILTILGNSDSSKVSALTNSYPGISNIHLQEICINGTPFTGINGTIPVPFRSRICLKEKTVLRKLSPLVNKETVLVAHSPPYGTLDRVLKKFHAGSKGVDNLINKNQPKLFLCGHIHEDAGVTNLNQTLVVNCSMGSKGEGALINLKQGNDSEVTFL